MTQWPLLEQQVRTQYRLLNHQGFYTRVRASHEKEEKYLFGIEEILEWARPRSSVGNLFLSRNPFTKEREVASITGFTVDVDQIREPKDRATTEAELRRTLSIAAKINSSLGGCGVVATSGNGALLLYPFSDPVTDDLDGFVDKAKRFEKQLQDQFQTSEVRIDATNYAKAILRMVGSRNLKDADPTKHRYARFIGRPVFYPKRSRLRDVIERTVLPESITVPELHSSTNSTVGQSVSVPVLALHNEATGLGPAARLELAEKSLRRLDTKRVDNYDDWLKCGIALKEFGPAGLEMWKSWSRQSSKYHEGDCEAKYRSFRGDQKITVGTLKYWADIDDTRPGLLSGNTVQTVPEPGGTSSERPKLWTPGERVTRFGTGETGGVCNQSTVSTGFKWLDSKLSGGYRSGTVYVIHGVTNSGKSTFIVQAARTVCETGKRVLFIATEATEKEIEERYLASGTGISTSAISTGSVNESDKRVLADYQATFRTHQIGIHYTTNPDTELITWYIEDFKPDLIVWDYYQHFETTEGMRYNQLGEYARWFESTAIKYQVPILVGSQLHLRKDFKTGKKKQADMMDVKDCAIINDAAKTVMVLDWSPMDSMDDEAPATVLLSLNKNKGGNGSTSLLLRRNVPRFEEI